MSEFKSMSHYASKDDMIADLRAQLLASQERERVLREALRHISDFNWKECERCSESIDGDWEVDHSREIASQALERAGME